MELETKIVIQSCFYLGILKGRKIIQKFRCFMPPKQASSIHSAGVEAVRWMGLFLSFGFSRQIFLCCPGTLSWSLCRPGWPRLQMVIIYWVLCCVAVFLDSVHIVGVCKVVLIKNMIELVGSNIQSQDLHRNITIVLHHQSILEFRTKFGRVFTNWE